MAENPYEVARLNSLQYGGNPCLGWGGLAWDVASQSAKGVFARGGNPPLKERRSMREIALKNSWRGS